VPGGPRSSRAWSSARRLTVPDLGPYRLYQLFSLAAEQETLSLVRRTAAAAGLLLVGLLA
jgi:hypothetical protein